MIFIKNLSKNEWWRFAAKKKKNDFHRKINDFHENLMIFIEKAMIFIKNQ